jgi:hypothetical protein
MALVSRPEPDWNWGVVVPEDWLTVDVALPPADRRCVMVARVEELVAQTPAFEADAVRLVDIAEAVIDHAVANQALFVAVGFDHVGTELVAMSAAGYGLLGRFPPDLEALVEALQEPRPEDINGREVTTVELPVGPAVRLHVIYEAYGGETDEGVQEPMVLEGVDHFIPVPQRTDMLLLSCTTPSVSVSDQLLPLFDAIAATVELEPI